MPPPPAKKIKESQLVFVYGKKNLSMVPVDTIIVVVFSDLDNRVCMTCSIESAFIAILCGLFDCQFIFFYRDIFEESFFFSLHFCSELHLLSSVLHFDQKESAIKSSARKRPCRV